MKRVFVLCSSLMLLLCSCASTNYERCNLCKKRCEETSLLCTAEDDLICGECASAASYYSKCVACDAIYHMSIGDNSFRYCQSCIEEYAATCCGCGGTFDKFDLARFPADDGLNFYFCVKCMEAYYEQIGFNPNAIDTVAIAQP